MDCEKCEDLLLDELYGELDDVTSALVRRHVAGCSRCNAILSDFKGTRELVSSFPVVTPPTSLEERIFAAEKDARKVVPIRSRALGFVSVAGRWAMRPQTAMAALFLLMIGSTTFLLKGRGGSHASAPVTVAQEGAPMAQAPASKAEALDPNAARGAHGPLEQQAQGTPPPAASAASTVVAALDETVDKQPRDLELAKSGQKEEMANADKPSRTTHAAAREAYADDDRITNAAAPAGAPAPTTATVAANAPAPQPAAIAQYGADSKSLGGASGGGGAAGPGYAQQAALGNGNSNGNGNGKKDGDSDDFSQGMAAYQSRQYPAATQSFDRAGGRGDLNASLYAARSVRDGQGCGAAIPRFDAVAVRGGTSFVGADATFDGAQCYAQVGNVDMARAKYTQLLNVASHAQRARQALDSLNQVATRRASPPRPAAKAAAPPAAAPVQAAPPPAQATTPPQAAQKAASDTGL